MAIKKPIVLHNGVYTQISDSDTTHGGSVATRGESLAKRAESQGSLDNSLADLGISYAKRAESQGLLDNSLADRGQSIGIRAESIGRLGGSAEISGLQGSENLLENGDFAYWPNGDSSAPYGWLLAGAGATIAKESTIVKIGNYSTKLTRSGTDCVIYTNAHLKKGATYFRGRNITFGCWVYATVASRAYIYIGDNGGTTVSSPHTGDSTWQWLTVTRTVNAGATLIQPALYVANGNTSAYFDGAICIEGTKVFAYDEKPINNLLLHKADSYSVISTIDLLGNLTYTNKGASGEITYTLPAGSANYKVSFLVVAAQYLKVVANVSDKFRYQNSQGAAGGYIRNNVPGTFWSIEWDDNGSWLIHDLTSELKYDE